MFLRVFNRWKERLVFTMKRLVFLILLCVSSVALGVETEQHITHGPILGRLTDTSIGVWARTGHPGKFAVRYGLAPEALVQESNAVNTALASDCTAWIEIRNLKPKNLK